MLAGHEAAPCTAQEVPFPCRLCLRTTPCTPTTPSHPLFGTWFHRTTRLRSALVHAPLTAPYLSLLVGVLFLLPNKCGDPGNPVHGPRFSSLYHGLWTNRPPYAFSYQAVLTSGTAAPAQTHLSNGLLESAPNIPQSQHTQMGPGLTPFSSSSSPSIQSSESP